VVPLVFEAGSAARRRVVVVVCAAGQFAFAHFLQQCYEDHGCDPHSECYAS